MAKTFDGSIVADKLPKIPCGGTPLFDYGAGYGYRCDICFAVIGSIGMPKSCKELLDQQGEE